MKHTLLAVLILVAVLVAVPVAAQTPVSTTQMALAQNAAFQNRCAYIAAQVAMTVRQESAATANHLVRDKLAQHVIADPVAWVKGLMPVIVGLTNVVADGENITDAALLSQISAVWNVFAGVVTE